MRYYFGPEARLRRAVEDAVVSVFTNWSYEEITTPSVDYYALFERGMGREEAHRAVRFMDGDGRLLALRPDVTSSVARAAATLLPSESVRCAFVTPRRSFVSSRSRTPSGDAKAHSSVAN